MGTEWDTLLHCVERWGQLVVAHMNPCFFASQWDNSTGTVSYCVSAGKAWNSQLDYAHRVASQPWSTTIRAWLFCINSMECSSGHIICKDMTPGQRVMRKEQNNRGLGLFIGRANINSIKITTSERYECLKGTSTNERVNCFSWCRQTLVGERLELNTRRKFLWLDYRISCMQISPSQ